MNTVNLTDNHFKVICKALEIYYRLKSGQINMALNEAFDYKIDISDLDLIESLIRQNTHKNLSAGAAYGFNNKEMGGARIAYEIKKTFEEVLAVKHNDGYYGNTVDFNGPLKASEEPFPEVVSFVKYKDFKLNSRQSKVISRHILNKDYERMWKYFGSLKLEIPKGEKTEILLQDKNAVVRVWKPRKN